MGSIFQLPKLRHIDLDVSINYLTDQFLSGFTKMDLQLDRLETLCLNLGMNSIVCQNDSCQSMKILG